MQEITTIGLTRGTARIAWAMMTRNEILRVSLRISGKNGAITRPIGGHVMRLSGNPAN